MYETKSRTELHFIILFVVASLMVWTYINYFNPVITEATCSDIAAASSNLRPDTKDIDPGMTYENIKLRCIQESLAAN